MITIEEWQQFQQKVFIAKPAHELARYTDYYDQLSTVIYPAQTAQFPAHGIYIANVQNTLVRQFLQTDSEYFWLLNDDQMYGTDILLRLLKHDKDLIVPLCLLKDKPHFPLIYRKHPDNRPRHYKHIRLEKGMQGLIEIEASGGGGLLVKRKVFEAIDDPWFDTPMTKGEKGWMQQTEDFYFWDKVNAAGFKGYCDLDIGCGHITQYVLRPQRDPEGNWYTVLQRGDERIAMPAETLPGPKIHRPDRRIVVPELQTEKL